MLAGDQLRDLLAWMLRMGIVDNLIILIDERHAKKNEFLLAFDIVNHAGVIGACVE